MRFANAFVRFWYDFVVGEDWRIAAGVVGSLAVGAILVAGDLISNTAVAVAVAAAIVLVVVTSVVVGAVAGRR